MGREGDHWAVEVAVVPVAARGGLLSLAADEVEAWLSSTSSMMTAGVVVSASVEIVEVAAELATCVLVALTGVDPSFVVVDASDVMTEMVDVAVVEDALFVFGATTVDVDVAAVAVALPSDVEVEMDAVC
jgi:hypothetical protein